MTKQIRPDWAAESLVSYVRAIRPELPDLERHQLARELASQMGAPDAVTAELARGIAHHQRWRDNGWS